LRGPAAPGSPRATEGRWPRDGWRLVVPRAVHRGWAALGTPAAARLACWYLGLALPTLAFKAHFLGVTYVGGIPAVIRPLAASSTSIPEWLYRVLLFTGDLIEVLALQALVLATGALLRVRLDVLVFPTVLGAVLLGGLNYLSSRQIGQFLTVAVARDVARWLATNPEGLTGFVTPRRVVAVAAGGVLACLPVLAAGAVARPGRRLAGLGRLVARATAAAVVGAVILHGGLLGAAFAREPAFRGYWSQAVLTFVGVDEPDPRDVPTPSPASLRERYRTIAFPDGTAPAPEHVVEIPAAARRPRHIVIVSLETAARKYYPLDAEESWPVLRRMAERSLVSDLHYTTAPYTTSALFSVLSGAYPRAGALPSRYGAVAADGLASVLEPHGYEATYIESSVLSFWKDYVALLRGLGFARVLEGREPSVPGRRPQALRNEELAFERAFEAVAAAEQRGRKAVVCLSSSFGHFPWKVSPEDSALPGREKLIRVGRVFDGLLGTLLARLEARRLREEVIIVVTGDHGPRFLDELASLGEDLGHGDATFNVPLLVYAPGLLSRQVRLPHVTSHVDITPTLLYLVGLEPEHFLFHGGNVLDGRLRERVTYLMGAGLYPVDGLHWRGRMVTVNRVTGEVRSRPRDREARGPAAARLEDDPRRLLRSARAVFEATAALFLARGRQRAVP
jgi:hypothetical protein